MPSTPKTQALQEKLEQDILASQVSYGELNWVLEYLVAEYQEKASNLLNETSIQKVVDTPRFS
jgi:hypothetical protein